MDISDTVADALTRIRNANEIKKEAVDIPHSNFKESIVEVLQEEGYIRDYRVYEKQNHPDKEPHRVLRVYLKYTERGERILQGLERFSKPGRRRYAGAEEIPRVMDGLGVMILSTSKGVMSDRKARKLGLGGELLFKVW